MKHFIIILITTISFLNCKAQNHIIPIDTYYQDANEGDYFKDLNNELNPFIGTWKYTNGSTSFTITLQKKVMVYDGEYYEDLLIGEYRYVENGVEKVNTLPQLNGILPSGVNSIYGRKVINPDYYNVPCDDCAPTERRVKLHMRDPDRNYLPTSSITLRYLFGENPEKIAILIKSESGGIIPEGVPDSARFPLGEFVLIKQ